MDRELFFQLLRGAVPGGIAGCLLMLIAFWRYKPEGDSSTSRRLIIAICTLAALTVGAFAIAFPLRVPSGLFDWFGWVPVAIAMVAIAVALSPWRIAGGFIAAFGLLIGLLFSPAADWSAADLKSFVLALVIAAGAAAFVHPVWQKRPLLLLAANLVAAGGMSQVLVLGFHALKLGQAAGIGASLLGGLAAGTLILHLQRKTLPPLIPLALTALLYSAAALAQAPVVTETKLDWLLILLLASVPGAATASLLLFQRKGTVIQWVTTLMLAGGPIVVAMGIILATREQSPSGY